MKLVVSSVLLTRIYLFNNFYTLAAPFRVWTLIVMLSSAEEYDGGAFEFFSEPRVSSRGTLRDRNGTSPS